MNCYLVFIGPLMSLANIYILYNELIQVLSFLKLLRISTLKLQIVRLEI